LKKNEVQIGGTYRVKVSGTVVTVRITGENPHGGYDGVSTATGRKIRIKTAGRLRGVAEPRPAKRKVITSAAEALAGKASAEHLKAVHKADQENARLAEQRSGSADGQTASERAMAESAATEAQDRPSGKRAGKGKHQAKDAPQANTGDAGKASGKRRPVVVAGPAGLSDVERKALTNEPPKDGKRKAKTKGPKAKRPSGLDAAAQVLAEAGEPLNAKTIVDRMLAKGLWKTGGRTPWATIYAALIRHIAEKGQASRFRKVDRGLFALAK
jgi:hypothetical protein